MKNLLSKIWFPTVLIGAAALQSFGIDAERSARLFRADDTLAKAQITDSISGPDSIVSTMAVSGIDTVFADVTDTIGHADTSLPAISARDTIKVPDSLKDTDPVRYRYYVALIDSATRHQLRDSLLSAGDSIELSLLDSLYYRDSSETAYRDSIAWFNSLSRKEKKKYLYEKELPAKMARMDSILNRKDSLKALRDSIREATPRILETYAIPDSMQYKRLILWEHDRYFNDVRLQAQDTSYNYHFYDYPFLKEDVNASYLGVIGSPVQKFNFFKRDRQENVIFYDPYVTYSHSPETLPMFNTKTPYTELAYWGTLFANTEKEESDIKILTTQNILPELNLTLEYQRFGSNGMLQNEDTDNRTFVAATNYMGKRYLMHAGYIYNKISKSENGGLIDNSWIRDTTVDAREIDVYLSDADNRIKKNTLFLDQSYRIPFSFIHDIGKGKRKARLAEQARKDSIMASGDSIAIMNLLAEDKQREEDKMIAADTIDNNVTTAFIGHCSEYSVFTKMYTDNISAGDENGRAFYSDYYLNPTQSADSLRVMKFDNRLFIRLQPWSSEGIISKLDVGIGDKLLNYYDFNRMSYLSPSSNVVRNSVYLYAGAQGKLKKYMSWDATGRYTFLGSEINDFFVNANLTVSIFPFRKMRNSPLMIKGHFETDLQEPDYYQQHFHSNHFWWDNSFGKISTTRAEASVSIPHWKFDAGFSYALLGNNIYYDNNGIVRQNDTPMSVMTVSAMKNFRLWKFHFDHRALFQISSNEAVLPLPALALNLRYYFQFDVKKNVMQMQLGANATYTTKWYAPSYNPALGVFHNQTDDKYGNCPYIDAFVNIQWKRACIFVKIVNVGMGWPNNSADYFTAHHYIHSQRAIKFGIFWPFYIQPSKNASIGGSSNSAAGSRTGAGNFSTANR